MSEPAPSAVPNLGRVSRERFSSDMYASAVGVPCIIEGVADGWPLMECDEPLERLLALEGDTRAECLCLCYEGATAVLKQFGLHPTDAA